MTKAHPENDWPDGAIDPAELHSTIIESGVLSASWCVWFAFRAETGNNGIEEADLDWTVTLDLIDPASDQLIGTQTFDAWRVWVAMLACAEGRVRGISADTMRDCRRLTAENDPQVWDIATSHVDADIADQILQVAAFGRVIFG